MWDVLLAEDPQLDLVDMVCVAMLLRIRWQCELAQNDMNLPSNYKNSGECQLFASIDAPS